VATTDDRKPTAHDPRGRSLRAWQPPAERTIEPCRLPAPDARSAALAMRSTGFLEADPPASRQRPTAADAVRLLFSGATAFPRALKTSSAAPRTIGDQE